MVRDLRGLFVTACLAIGAAAVVFPFLPGRWPNPLHEGTVARADDVQRLAATNAAVADACARGDVGAFEAATTSAHRASLARGLAAVDAVLDTRTLRAIGESVGRCDWFALPLLAGEVRGTRAVVVIARPHGDGAQMLSYVWDGRHLRFDGGRHLPAVRTTDAARTAVATEFAAPR